MRRFAALFVVLTVLAPTSARADGPPPFQAGVLYRFGSFATVERDRNGGAWAFEQQRPDQRLSLNRQSRDGSFNDPFRAAATTSAGLAYDDATDSVYFDAGGPIHRYHESSSGSTDDVVTTGTDVRGLDFGGGVLLVVVGDRIQRLVGGALETVPGGDGFTGTRDVAAAPDGSVLVIADGRLWRLADGTRTAVTAVGALHDPSVVDVGTDGAVYVGERAGRVVLVGTDGSVRVVAGGGSCTAPCGVGGPATSAALDPVTSLAVNGTDLWFVTRSGGSGLGQLYQVRDPQHPVSFAPGYRFVAGDGGIFTFGSARFFGSTGSRRLNQPIVAGASHGASGYWLVARDGGVFSFGDAPFRGAATGRTTSPVVALSPTADGDGYWIVERNGHSHAFGAASPVPDAAVGEAVAAATTATGVLLVVGRDGRVSGGGVSSGPILGLTAPVVGVATTKDGGGYWLVAADGRVFARGTAADHGSLAGRRLNAPVLGMAISPTGNGYWLVAADGGVFSFGDARFLGSTGGMRLNRPVVGVL